MDAIHKLMLTMRSARGLLSIFLLTTYTASFGASSAIGQTLWPVNGHRYLVVNQTATWQQAKQLAEGMMFTGVQGHLATITSEDENTFVTTQLGVTVRSLAGRASSLPAARSPEGGWQWITGEPWVYTNWDVGTNPTTPTVVDGANPPTGQSEERLQYHHNGTHWNDLPRRS